MFQLVSEGYFPVLKIQFVDGRGFTEAEINGARRLAIVNQTFVKKVFGQRESDRETGENRAACGVLKTR